MSTRDSHKSQTVNKGQLKIVLGKLSTKYKPYVAKRSTPPMIPNSLISYQLIQVIIIKSIQYIQNTSKTMRVQISSIRRKKGGRFQGRWAF